MKFAFFLSLLLVVAARAQAPPTINEQDLRQLLGRLDTHAEELRSNYRKALNRSTLRGAEQAEYVDRFADELQRLTDRMKSRSADQKPFIPLIQQVLNRGVYLESDFSRSELGPAVEGSWQKLRQDLDQLAQGFGIPTRWPTQQNASAAVAPDPAPDHLTGTYRIDGTLSINAKTVVEQIVRNLPAEDRRRFEQLLLRQMRIPRDLAIQRSGNAVRIASSFDGPREYLAGPRTNNIENVRGLVVALYGDQLLVDSNNGRDGMYSVNYDAYDLGARLRVTRTFRAEWLPLPVVVNSFYRKTSDLPNMNLAPAEHPASETPGGRRSRQ